MANPDAKSGSVARKPRARRGRPPSIDTEMILAVAREVFLEQGFRATTQEVAERAGISEGSLFHRFKSKEGLFRAAMNLPEEAVPELLLHAVEKLHGLQPREALQELAAAVLDIGKVGIPLMMMSWSNPNQCGNPYDKNRAKFREVMKRLAGYFESQMLAGKLRQIDPEILARVFVGSVHHYCMTRIFSADDTGAMVPEGMFVRGLVDLVLDGAAARPNTAAT